MGLEDRLFISDTRSPTAMTEKADTTGGYDKGNENANGPGNGNGIGVDNAYQNATISRRTNLGIPNTGNGYSNASNVNDGRNMINDAGSFLHSSTERTTGPGNFTDGHQTSVRSTIDSGASSSHGHEGDEPPRKRRRPALSCEPCRRRKVRCDRVHPCGPCVRMRVPQACEYDNRFPRAGLPPGVNEFAVPRTADYRPQNQDPETPSRGYAEFEREIVHHAHSSAPQAGPSRVTNSNGHQAQEPTQAALSSPDELQQTVRELQYRVSRTERLASAPSTNVPDFSLLQSQMQLLQEKFSGLEDRLARTEKAQPTPEPVANANEPNSTGLSIQLPAPLLRKGTSKVYGPTHYAHLLDPKTDVFGRMIAKQGHSKFDFSQNCRMRSALGVFNQVRFLRTSIKDGQRIKSFDSIRHSIESALYWESRHKLVDKYFHNLENIHRVLHRRTFWPKLMDYSQRIDHAPDLFVVQIILVCAVGSVFVDEANELRDLAPKWIYSAQSWMSGPNEKSFADEASIQNWCLLLIARQACNVGTKEQNYALAGSMVRNAFALALHRDPARLEGMTFYWTQMRRCIWSAVLELSLITSFDAGRPPLLSVDDFDAEPPLEIDDADMDEKSESARFWIMSRPGRSTGLQRFLRKSFAVRLEIAQMLHSFKREMPCDRAHELILDLQNTLREAAHHFSRAEWMVLGLRLHNATIRTAQLYLCSAILASTRADDRFKHFHELAFSVSKDLLSNTLDEDASEHWVSKHLRWLSPFSRFFLRGAGCLFKSGFSLNAIAIVSQVLLGQLKTLAISATDPIRQSTIELLEKKKDESLQILRAGDAACKCFVYLHVTLALIKARENGQALNEVVPTALTEALEICVQELQKLADGNAPLPTDPNDVDLSMFNDIDFSGLDPTWLLGAWNFGWV